MANDIILKEYETLLGQISTLESRLSTIISQTSSALSTINTSYDLIETESQESDYDNFGGFLLNTLTMGISGQVHKHQQISEINSDIEYDIDRCRSALGNLNKYVSSGAGLFATFRGVFDGLYNADSLSAEDIQNILTGYNLTTCFSPVGASTSLSEIRDRTEVTSFDVKKHDSYGTMSLRQAIFGDFSDDSTMAGAGMGLVLQFIPFVDTACDIRDVAADGKNIYKYETSNDKSWGKSAEVYGFTTLDVAAFIPFVGALKYTDEIADGAKAMDKVHDVGKSIDKVNDARRSMSKIDDIADAAKGASKSTDTIGDIAKSAGKTADVGKTADAGKSIGKATDAGKAADTTKVGRTPRESEINTQRILDNSSDDFTHQTILDENLNSISKREAGSIAPDHMAAYDANGNVIKGDSYAGASHFEIVEDKNYSIENSSGRSNLIQNIVEQAENRNARLGQNGATVHQTYRIDVTGHENISLNSIESLYNKLMDKLPDNVDIEFVLK